MIKAYSQRLMPPYSGQVQIAESERARMLTMDGATWEVHFQYAGRSYRRVAYMENRELRDIVARSGQGNTDVDERIVELARFIAASSLPYPAADRFEYWLLDRSDGSPLALIFSCTSAEQMETYPSRPQWTALPAAVLPIEATPEETDRRDSPVNYRVESMVSQRAGSLPVARWYERHQGESEFFPPFMIREDWEDPVHSELCRRYIERQSTRLLMLHGLSHADRLRLEGAARQHIFEVERFFQLYPEVADEKSMKAILVEARLRGSESGRDALLDRRDGVLYQ